MGIDQFVFQVFDKGIVETKLPFQGTVGHTPLALEECENVSNDLVEIHYRPSSSACNNAFASCRSAVSNPSVNHPYTGARRSWAAWGLPCCCQSRARLVAARSSKDLACWFWAIIMA